MRTGGLFKEVNGLMWPDCDVDCMAVTFDAVGDSDIAIKYCEDLDAVVQAGGNAGVWPIYLSKIFKRVYTFEPDTMNYACLRHNCSKYDNIFAMMAALGETPGKCYMEYPEGKRNMGACRIIPLQEKSTIPASPVYSLDSLSWLPKIDFIQLDVEGYEPFVIAGALGIINKYHPVIMLEDKGLTFFYGRGDRDWSDKILGDLGYRLAERIARDKIFVYDN